MLVALLDKCPRHLTPIVKFDGEKHSRLIAHRAAAYSRALEGCEMASAVNIAPGIIVLAGKALFHLA